MVIVTVCGNDWLTRHVCEIQTHVDLNWTIHYVLELGSAIHSEFLASRGQLKCDGTRAETRFCLSAKRTSPFKSAGVSVQSTTGSRGVCISGSNAGYTMFRGSVKGTGCPLHSQVSPSLPLPCVTVCHRISTGVYLQSRSADTLFICQFQNGHHTLWW